MQLKNNQGMTASDFCKIDPDKGRLIDQLMSKFITGEVCVVVEINAKIASVQLKDDESWIKEGHKKVLNAINVEEQSAN